MRVAAFMLLQVQIQLSVSASKITELFSNAMWCHSTRLMKPYSANSTCPHYLFKTLSDTNMKPYITLASDGSFQHSSLRAAARHFSLIMPSFSLSSEHSYAFSFTPKWKCGCVHILPRGGGVGSSHMSCQTMHWTVHQWQLGKTEGEKGCRSHSYKHDPR